MLKDKKKIQFEETKQATEPDSDMAETFEWSDWELTMINHAEGSNGKVDHMQEHMDSVSRGIGALRIKGKCQTSKTLTEMKNDFDQLTGDQ